MAEEQISQEAVESAPTEEVSRETSDVPIPERPEHIPEKFWNAETGEVKTEDLAKSYINLEKFSKFLRAFSSFLPRISKAQLIRRPVD